MTNLSLEFEEWGRQKGILKGHDLVPLYGRNEFDDGHWRAFCAEKGIDPRDPWGTLVASENIKALIYRLGAVRPSPQELTLAAHEAANALEAQAARIAELEAALQKLADAYNTGNRFSMQGELSHGAKCAAWANARAALAKQEKK